MATNGDQLSLTPVSAGTATITVTATDGKGGTVSRSFTVHINRAPDAGLIADQVVTLGTNPFDLDLQNLFQDADGDALTLSALSANPGVASVTLNGTRLTITPVAFGTTTVTVTADDLRGGKVSRTFTILVNRVPQATTIADQTVTLGTPDTTLNLTHFFTDADGDVLTWNVVTADANTASVTVNGDLLSITPVAVGTTTVTVTANDGNGGTVSKTFQYGLTKLPLLLVPSPIKR